MDAGKMQMDDMAEPYSPQQAFATDHPETISALPT